jgi:hypothetical protein
LQNHFSVDVAIMQSRPHCLPLKRKDNEMETNAEFIIFDEEIKDKLKYDRQSAFNDISGIFKFASEVLKTGGKVTVRRLADADIAITDESGLSAYKEGFNKLQRDLNRKQIK